MSINKLKAAITLIPMCLSIVLWHGCSTKAPLQPVQPAERSVSATVDQTGGVIQLGQATVTIPAGALEESVTISLAEIASTSSLPPNFTASGKTYSILPHGVVFREKIIVSIPLGNLTGTPELGHLDNEQDLYWTFLQNVTFANGLATTELLSSGILKVIARSPFTEIYVSADSKGSHASGTRQDPLPTITLGIEASLDAGTPLPPVYVGMGIYEESIELKDGISIYGGYDATFETRELGAHSTVRLGVSPAVAESISAATVVSGIEFKSSDAITMGANSIALRLSNCSDQLRFEDCKFGSGRGGDGLPGEGGAPGANGQDGHRGYERSDGYASGAAPGGSGAHRGGDGGPGWPEVAVPGSAGAGPAGGVGGAGAIGCVDWTNDGSPGGNGGNGSPGANGSGGALGSANLVSWLPGTGSPGLAGQPGSGGGGGGSGAMCSAVGGSGGGGGGGGYAGQPGTGGQGGGSSFAVFLAASSPAFVRCQFTSGTGGSGGEGGRGGKGGPGGTGGIGGTGEVSDIGAGRANGGNGGNGGMGGDGGGGQGGPGGLSFCVFKIANSNPDLTNGNIFQVGSPGLGGTGGRRGGDGDQAARGPDGISGEIGSADSF